MRPATRLSPSGLAHSAPGRCTLSRASAGGGPWSNPQALRVANGSSGSVLAVDGSGNVLVVWEGLAARYTAATSTWSSVWTLFTGSVGEAQLVVDDVGDATVMWFGYQSQGYVAYSIGYSASSDTWRPAADVHSRSGRFAMPGR